MSPLYQRLLNIPLEGGGMLSIVKMDTSKVFKVSISEKRLGMTLRTTCEISENDARRLAAFLVSEVGT